MNSISNLAFVHPEAKLGDNVVVEAFAFVDQNTEIGDGTRIMSHATVLYGSRIGKNCTIFPHATIAGIPQDLKFQGEDTTAEIGDNTTVRECATRSEEHTSELQSRPHLVCRLLLEKKK